MTPSIKIPREVVEKINVLLRSMNNYSLYPTMCKSKASEALALLAPYLKDE